VVAIVDLRGWPRRKAWANFTACLYSTLPGSGGSSGFTFTSTRAGPPWLSAWLTRSPRPCPTCGTWEYFHDHQRIERVLFDGTLDPVGGVLTPDPGRPGLGLELRSADAEPYREG
jgi:hypothetical protein